MIAELVNHGLAILTAEKGSEGGKRSAVAKVSITDAVTRGSRMPAD
jgi:hypothetical protein